MGPEVRSLSWGSYLGTKIHDMQQGYTHIYNSSRLGVRHLRVSIPPTWVIANAGNERVGQVCPRAHIVLCCGTCWNRVFSLVVDEGGIMEPIRIPRSV